MKRSKPVLVHSPLGVKNARIRLANDRKPALTARVGTLVADTARVGALVADNVGVLLGGIVGSVAGTFSARTADRPRWTPAPQTALPVTIGLWSLEAWLGNLTDLIDALNDTQSTFIFYPVEAVVPAGLISRPERVISWYIAASGEELDDDIKSEVEDNLVANDFFGLADSVRINLGLDYIVGITASMVAGEDDDGYYLNHFSTCDGRTILVSSYDLQDFSRETGQPVEAFLANIIISQFLVAFAPYAGFHPDRGCLFDYDASRTSLKDKVKDPKIEPGCLDLIEPSYRKAVLGLIQSLEKLRRPTP